ncbi:MAG: 23S rRNA (uracil(1939)-C(5))-methyltransferase RlmD, partial [Firmicutes bacterium]|nr:23S rRNA (uracil(1939)-C(5))-methyltransferase RlmD [Bacillota bacterium]
GDGVGRLAGKAVFVEGAIPGDIVLARVVEERKNFARARLLSVRDPSPSRVNPACAAFEHCGGCSLQAMDYRAQLQWKRRIVLDAMARIGHLGGVAVHETVPSPSIWHYRNKAMFPVGKRDGALIAGCYKRGSHEIVPAAPCLIQHPTGNLILSEALRLCREHGIEPYDERTGRGILRHVMARVGTGTGESMAVLVTATARMPGSSLLARELAEAVPGLVSVIQNVNAERTNVVLGGECRVLWGKDRLDDVLGNEAIGRLRFRVSPLSFYQVNPEQAARVYERVLGYLGDSAGPGEETALDVYCGIGTITLFLARRFAAAVGVEESAEAVKDARRNAQLNSIENVHFVEGRAERVMPSLAASLAGSGRPPGAVVLDPPRAGCDEKVLEVVSRAGPRVIVYVSCYPATLARDLERLSRLGYRTVEVQPFDMFPHTPHVECVALLKKEHGP